MGFEVGHLLLKAKTETDIKGVTLGEGIGDQGFQGPFLGGGKTNGESIAGNLLTFAGKLVHRFGTCGGRREVVGKAHESAAGGSQGGAFAGGKDFDAGESAGSAEAALQMLGPEFIDGDGAKSARGRFRRCCGWFRFR